MPPPPIRAAAGLKDFGGQGNVLGRRLSPREICLLAMLVPAELQRTLLERIYFAPEVSARRSTLPELEVLMFSSSSPLVT